MKTKSLKNYAVLCYCTILIALTASAAGQAGQLDNTFGSGGIATQQTMTTRTSNFYSVGAIALQSNGRIVVAGGVPGNNDFTVPAVLRFLPNGNLDRSFGVKGVFVLPNSFGSYASIAIQPDGNILIGTSAGGPTAEVDRLTTKGHFDSTFGSGGRVTFDLSAFFGLALQPDGRILAGIQSLTNGPQHIVRLLANGATDTSFGTNGAATPPGGAGPMEVLANGDILVFGGLISRLTSAGAVDTAFGINGQLQAQTLGHALPGNGDILTAGTLFSDPAAPVTGLTAFAYQSVGIGDPAFGKNGGVLAAFSGFPRVTAAGMALQSTGDIVEVGTVSTATTGAFGLVRYTPQGQLDTSFGSGGTVATGFGTNFTANASAIAVQSDDKIVAAGTVTSPAPHGVFTTSLVLARYLGH